MMPYIKAIASRYRAKITLLHVVNPIYAIPETGISVPALVPVPEWVFKEKSQQLEQFALSELRDLPVRRLVYEGDPEAQIAGFTRTEDVDLVVMPTHGYGVVRRYLIGSITAKVLDDVACPVLTEAQAGVPASLAKGKVSHIVCGIDLGSRSADTLAWASRLAGDFDAKLSLIHVIPPISPGLYVTFTSRLKEEWEEIARKDVENLQKERGVASMSICIQEGDVARTVCSFAHSIGAHLLVIGRGVHVGGAGRLKTNAYAIIRQADCAVLSV